MKVTLISHTPNALATLVYTKSTRLSMTATGFDQILAMPEEKLMEEWEYMKNTIKSSWEFLEFLFLIEDVSRAFTHQLVRHRIGTKFAQQSQRTVDMGGFGFIMPPPGLDDPGIADEFELACESIDDSYQRLISVHGVKPQDARALLPTNVSTNINFGSNLRTLHDMARLRLCTKTQGEFQDVFRAIKAEVHRALPWAATVLQVECCWSGTCAFPTFPTEDCVLKPHVYDPTTGSAYQIKPGLLHEKKPSTLVQLREIDATRGNG